MLEKVAGDILVTWQIRLSFCKHPPSAPQSERKNQIQCWWCCVISQAYQLPLCATNRSTRQTRLWISHSAKVKFMSDQTDNHLSELICLEPIYQFGQFRPWIGCPNSDLDSLWTRWWNLFGSISRNNASQICVTSHIFSRTVKSQPKNQERTPAGEHAHRLCGREQGPVARHRRVGWVCPAGRTQLNQGRWWVGPQFVVGSAPPHHHHKHTDHTHSSSSSRSHLERNASSIVIPGSLRLDSFLSSWNSKCFWQRLDCCRGLHGRLIPLTSKQHNFAMTFTRTGAIYSLSSTKLFLSHSVHK